MPTIRRDRGSIVIGWLTKLVVALAFFGVFAFDGVSLTAAHIGASDDADQAAQVAYNEYHSSHNVQAAYDAAVASLPSDTESLSPGDFVVATDGTVDLVLHRTVQTLVFQHIGPLKKYTVVTVHGEATPPTV